MGSPPPSSQSSPAGAPPTESTARLAPSGAAFLRRIAGSREFSVVLVIAFICMLMPFTDARDTFFTQRNTQNILRNVALVSVFAIGETLVILTGGIDLSLGSLIAFTGMVLALVVTKLGVALVPPAAISLGICAALAVAITVGIIHATLVHKLRLPAFVVTLASLLILRSQAVLLNNQLQIPLQDYPGLLWLANGNFFADSGFPVPVPVVVMLVVVVIASIVLNRTTIGRYIYSLGSNETATMLSGVNIYRVKLFAYGASALLGGVAGILWAGYGGQGDPQAGNAYELDAVAASVVGGASLMGGQGSVLGTVFGALLLMVIFSAINLTLSNPNIWRGTVVGGVLLFAVLVTAFQQRRSMA